MFRLQDSDPSKTGTEPLWHNNYLRLLQKKEDEDGEPGAWEPEFRLPPAIAGGVLVPIGLFWCATSIAILLQADLGVGLRGPRMPPYTG